MHLPTPSASTLKIADANLDRVANILSTNPVGSTWRSCWWTLTLQRPGGELRRLLRWWLVASVSCWAPAATKKRRSVRQAVAASWAISSLLTVVELVLELQCSSPAAWARQLCRVLSPGLVPEFLAGSGPLRDAWLVAVATGCWSLCGSLWRSTCFRCPGLVGAVCRAWQGVVET